MIFVSFCNKWGSKNGVLEVGRLSYDNLKSTSLFLEIRQASKPRADNMI